MLFGACALPASEAVPDRVPVPAKPVVVYTHDEDFAADPPEPPHAPTEGPVSFASVTKGILDAAAQGQGNPRGKPRPILEAAECVALLAEANELVPGCAAEMLPGKCSRGPTFKASECPACAKMVAKDDELDAKQCPFWVEYLTLRLQ